MKMREIIPPGTAVLMGSSDDLLVGRVVEVLMDGVNVCHVQYKVVWWDGRTRRSEWLEESEVAPRTPDSTMGMGFQCPA